MSEKSGKWQASEIRSAPRVGLRLPGRLHETPDRLWQSSSWVYWVPGAVAFAGLAAFTLALLHLVLGLAGVAGWSWVHTVQLGGFSVLAAGVALLLYLYGVSSWESWTARRAGGGSASTGGRFPAAGGSPSMPSAAW
jgi:hypothetical protein